METNTRPYAIRPPDVLRDDYGHKVDVTVLHAYDPKPISRSSLSHLNGLDRILMLSARTSQQAKMAYLVLRRNLKSFPVGSYVIDTLGIEQQWYVVGKDDMAYVTMIKTVRVAEQRPMRLKIKVAKLSNWLAEL